MLAHALLAVFAAAARTRQPSPAGLIPLTCNEIARLLNRPITNPIRSLTSILRWSTGGDAATNTAPEPATTDADQQHDHELPISDGLLPLVFIGAWLALLV
jgi:hypothetical protein